MISKTDASTKILGFKYQEMIALTTCLEAKDGTKIYLECLGDVSDGEISTEVKHSIDVDKSLIDTHIDFWKTISNIVSEYDKFRFYNKFILHTTAKIKKGSIFEKWNDLTKTAKSKEIKSVIPNETIKTYNDNVKSFDLHKLKDILDKLEIHDSQDSAKTYFEHSLINHSGIINIIKEKNREEFVCQLLGYISKELITSTDYVWEIDINLFRSNFQAFANRYQLDDLEFPVSNVTADISLKDRYRFVKTLENINYQKKIGSSMNNYLRASDSQLKMIKSRTSLSESLENYDADIKEIVEDLKESHIDQITSGSDMNENSRRLLDDSLEKITPITKIEGVTSTRTYYPKGRLIHNLEIESINLNLEDEG